MLPDSVALGSLTAYHFQSRTKRLRFPRLSLWCVQPQSRGYIMPKVVHALLIYFLILSTSKTSPSTIPAIGVNRRVLQVDMKTPHRPGRLKLRWCWRKLTLLRETHSTHWCVIHRLDRMWVSSLPCAHFRAQAVYRWSGVTIHAIHGDFEMAFGVCGIGST